MQSLTKQLQPWLNAGVSFSDLPEHVQQATGTYIFFRSSAIVDSGDPRKIKAAIEAMPEPVRDRVRAECRRLYRARFLDQNDISRQPR